MNKSTSVMLKGLACIIVLMCHFKITNIFSTCGYLAVGIFYFFSGYGLAYCTLHKKNYIDTFLVKKFIHIFVPFYIIYFVYDCICDGGVSIKNFVYIFNPFNPCEYLWYVKSIIYIYIYYFIIYKILEKISGNVIDKIGRLGVLVWILAGISMITFTTDPNRFLSLGFIVGWYFAIKEEKDIGFFKNKYWLIIVEFVLIIAFHLTAYYLYNNIGLYILSQYMGPTLCGILCYTIAVNFEFDNKCLLGLGMISYEMYLAHPVMLKVCEKFSTIKYLVGMYVGSVLIAIVLYFFVSIIDKKAKKQFNY